MVTPTVERHMSVVSSIVRRIVPATIAFAAVASVASAQQRVPAPLQGFDAYVTKAMQEWDVPGIAIAIVRDDSVIFSRGFGVRKLGDPSPVSPSTMFAIGSSSKAFTAAVIAMLADEGKLRFDDPATRHLPGFEMYDPYVTRELTVRDLLSHRSGLARGDLLWYGSSYDRSEILRRVRFLKPTWSMRSNFGYQNIMYLAAGQVAASVTGRSWDDLVRDRILVPLGMTSTVTTVAPLASAANVAQPHVKLDGVVRVVPYRNIDNIGPAGSLNSNVEDMAKWVRFQLAGGKAGGKQLISTASFDEMHTPHTVIRTDATARRANPYVHLRNYGLGWFLHDYRGRLVVQHGGNIDGMSALVAMMPEEKVGMVILTNMNGSGLPGVLMNTVFDRFLGAPAKDWSSDMRKIVAAQEKTARETAERAEKQRVTGTAPSLALDKYAGEYADSMYGEATVAMQNGKLGVKFGQSFEGTLEHWHYDTFRATWRDPTLGKSFVTFVLDPSAKISEMKVENLTDFRRRAAKADTVAGTRIAAADLPQFVGKFGAKELPFVVEVQVVNGALTLTVPGQPAYTLVAVTPTRFRLTGAGVPDGFFLDYTMEQGKVKSVKLEQAPPQPTMVLTPVA